MLDKKIHYFIKVVEEKSFSKAAEKLFLSQPNLSKQVKFLEEELGVELLDRKGYRPVLTSAGESHNLSYYHLLNIHLSSLFNFFLMGGVPFGKDLKQTSA